MIGIIVSSASALAVATGCVYNKCFSKKAREKKAQEHQERVKKSADELLFAFSTKYDDFVKKNQELEKLDKTRAIWIDSSEDDPTSREMLKDIHIKMELVGNRIKLVRDEINIIVKKIFDNKDVFNELKSRQPKTEEIKKVALWKQNHAAEIKALK